ncbi:hypothetical protein GGTG_02828 [Gaeumannomyces tritici R3-111a-1]|uniref:DUF427 domain-containing protein n=1 Tax=Gaeumannomyces tritici (strain R3-111a-1) TaxID=644352 RepID=J3NNH2_GAET3|nr:hypothetical protein GGTG_02828 [Gaeumannomyces tritici R3-111a-1]EJT77723.1 hypothetical protein GGTG_02828 [Gaeumannomyces tritici R3-111a-1]
MVSGKATASVDGKTVAETTEWEEVEGNVYFPPGALDRDLFSGPTSLHTTCGWKGEASYYTITVGDKTLENAAWYYPTPKPKAEHIKDYVAFYKTKVDVTKTVA